MEKNIDIVIPWVDGSDPIWQKQFIKYKQGSESRDSNSIFRYRDWNNLQYIFRGIEKYTPWVRKVHLITSGQKPIWLNINAPKLNFVTHDQFIPAKYLPTFSARPIELNLHRIKDLAEKFIYFNDDFFIISPMDEECFFKSGLPCDIAALNVIQPTGARRNVIFNCVGVINKYFDKRKVLRKDRKKWFSLNNRTQLFRTIALLPWNYFPGFYDTHLPQPYLKSVLSEVWEKEQYLLQEVSSHRFRDIDDVNQSLFRYWQLASGIFYPTNVMNKAFVYIVSDINADEVASTISMQKGKILVLNDSDDIRNFECVRDIINTAFSKILPQKSSFEL